MDNSSVRVPSALLLHRSLTTTAKVVWMAVRLEYQMDTCYRLNLTRLAARTGISRPTIRRGIHRLKASGWDPFRDNRGDRAGGSPSPSGVSGRWVTIPGDLIFSKALEPRAKVLYGVLLSKTRGRSGRNGQFTYASLSQLMGRCTKTVRRGVRTLERGGWLTIRQKNRRDPINYSVQNPIAAVYAAEATMAKRRLDRAEHSGEAIMQEYLSLLVDSDNFQDNARPGFLVNPLTGERLEFDRYYPHRVAFEFNGSQHYVAGGKYSPEDVKAQQLRDFLKAGICKLRGIELVIVHPEDLSLESMRKKVGDLLPLRDLSRDGPRIKLLESVARRYRRAAGRS